MRASASLLPDLGLPAIYLHLMVELLQDLRVDGHILLKKVGLDPSRLEVAEVRVSQSQAIEFFTRAIMESGEPGLGMLAGGRLKLPLHGTFGTALMSSDTLGDAVTLMTRYLMLRAPHIRVEQHQESNQVILKLFNDMDMGPLQGFVMDTLLGACLSATRQLLGSLPRQMEVRRCGIEPSYFQRLRHHMPTLVRYNCSEDAFVLPHAALNTPLRLRNNELAARSREQCEASLIQLTTNIGFTHRVRRVIETGQPFPPKLSQVSHTLFVSERTLKRRLHEEQASFQGLVDQVRLQRASELLEHTHMNLSKIADTLGYADAANFTRAFKRWTGGSPSQYRQQCTVSALQNAELAPNQCQ